AGDSDGDVDVGGNDLARLADLHFVRRIAGVDGGARRTDGCADLVREAEQQLEVLRTAERAAAGYHALGGLQIGTIGRTGLCADIARMRGQGGVDALRFD